MNGGDVMLKFLKILHLPNTSSVVAQHYLGAMGVAGGTQPAEELKKMWGYHFVGCVTTLRGVIKDFHPQQLSSLLHDLKLIKTIINDLLLQTPRTAKMNSTQAWVEEEMNTLITAVTTEMNK